MNWPETEPRVQCVAVTGDHRVQLTFRDGTIGEPDLSNDILGAGGIFEPLEDPAFFARVTVNPQAGTIEWPNQVDLCPDVLYSRITGIPIPFADQAEPVKQ